MTRVQHIGGGPIAMEFISDTGNLGSASTHTVPFSFGDALPRRAILVTLAYSGSISLNSLTIGGVAATRFIEQDSSTFQLAMAGAEVPTGTSGNVVAQFSGSTGLFVAAAWRMTRYRSLVPVDSAYNVFPFGSGAKSLLIDSRADGALWGGASTTAGDFPIFTAGFPTSGDFGVHSASGAHKLVTADQTNETISINQGPGSGGTYQGVVGAVSFR